MSVRFAAVFFLLLATSSLCFIAKNPKAGSGNAAPLPPGGFPSYPPFAWPPLPPGGFPSYPPFAWPPLPPGGFQPFPPGGWPPLPPGGFQPMPPGGWPRPGGGSCSCTCNVPPPRAPKVFMVGDDKQWSFGTNYTEWILKNGPFYLGDVLEFDYPAPVAGRISNHSVVLLTDYEHFRDCNLTEAVTIGDVYAGGVSGGFRFKLEPKFPSWDPFLYIACGEKKGFHCKVGTMKFALLPMLRGFP